MALFDSIRSTLRKRFSSTARSVTRLRGEDEARFTLRLPGADGSNWLEFACEIQARETGHGEDLHLRTHLRADFSRLLPANRRLRGTTEAPAALEHGHRETGRNTPDADAMPPARIGGATGLMVRGVQRGLHLPLVQRALAPLAEQRVESWMDIHGTTTPIDSDSRALLPEGLRALGVQPDPNGPPIQQWEGAVPGGVAQVTTMQLDERHLSAGGKGRKGKRGHGGQPMRIAASFAQLVQRVPKDRDDG